jgi:hypothetical protein
MDAKDLDCCFVVQATVPYYDDLNQVLALPAGFRYRNRYHRQWVEPNLRDDASRALGRRVLIILRDRERARLVPTRWGRIAVAQAIGDILHFEYLLEDLIAYGREPDQREADIQKYTAILSRYHKDLPGSPGKDLTRPSVFLSAAGPDLPTASADDLASWGNVVDAVATADIYEKVNFLKVVELSTLIRDGRNCAVSATNLRPIPCTPFGCSRRCRTSATGSYRRRTSYSGPSLSISACYVRVSVP